MSGTQLEIAELFLKGVQANRALQEHKRFDRMLDDADLSIARIGTEDSSTREDLLEAISEKDKIESEIEKRMILDRSSIMTNEEYEDSLKSLALEYLDIVESENTGLTDIVYQVKSFDDMTSAKMDAITEELLSSNSKIKRVYQSDFKNLNSFKSNSVFVMPSSEYENFSSIIKDKNNGLECVENAFFYLGHLNKEVNQSEIESTLSNAYENQNLEKFFTRELGLYVAPLGRNRDAKNEKLLEITKAFKEIIAQENLESEYGNKPVTNSIRKINQSLRYQDTKKLVTIVSESRKCIENASTEEINKVLKNTRKKTIKNV